MENLNSYLFEAAKNPELFVQFYSLKATQKYSYYTILENSQKVAHFLKSQGIKKGERVTIILPTEVNFYYAFFGCLLAGVVPAALYPPLSLGQFDEWKKRSQLCLDLINTKLILTNNLMVGVVNQLSSEKGTRTVEDIVKREIEPAAIMVPIEKIEASDLCFIQFSSGSTGIPKPVALTHFAVLSNALAILSSLPEKHNNRAVSWLPLYHDMGLIGCLITTLMNKGELTLIRPEQFLANPLLWFKALSETKANFSVAPNFAFGLCVKKISIENCADIDLSNWKNVLCGAEPISYKTLEEFGQKFSRVGFNIKAIMPVYGLSESALAVSFSTVGVGPQVEYFDEYELQVNNLAQVTDVRKQAIGLVSLGKPIKDIMIEIRDLENNQIADKRVGILWIKGPSLLKEYFNLPLETKQAFDNGWFNTGDRGFIYQGNLYLCGRFKDIIIVNGKNIDPSTIESEVNKLSFVRTGRCVAFAYFDSKTEQEVVMVVTELASDDWQNLDELKEQIKQQVLQNLKININDVIFLKKGELPRTSSGKVKRFETKTNWLKQKLVSQRATPNKFLLMLQNYFYKVKYRWQTF